MRRWLTRVTGAGAALLAFRGAAGAQPPNRPPRLDPVSVMAEYLIAMPAPATGREAVERRGLDDLTRPLEAMGWRVDALGSYVLRRGSGVPRRVVACAFDQPTFVVSEIGDDGYVRLHDPADPRRHPLWAQFHEGQWMSVETPSGSVEGVVGVRSTHLWRRRPAQEAPTSVDDLWLDLGATSRADVEQLGVRVLAPVRRATRPMTYGTDRVATGPGMAGRAACAAVVAAAGRDAPKSGETIYVLAAQSAFDYTGLSAVLGTLGHVDSLVLVDARLARGADTASSAPDEAVTVRPLTRPTFLAPRAAAAPVVALGVRSRFPGTLVEGVSTGDLNTLVRRVAAFAGLPPGAELTPEILELRPLDPGQDSLKGVATLLGRLAYSYGVSGHEGHVRDAVRSALPATLASRAVVDSAGNLILALGPDRDTVVFVAHLDEIGYEVNSIAPDGTVSLTPRGGFFPSLWEGQPAYLHFDADADARRAQSSSGCRLVDKREDASYVRILGVFVPRQTATKKQPDAQTAWFGADSAALVACGVHPGMAVTGVKNAQRLGRTRFSARSIDDRVGCTAQLLALRSIDPAKLTHKVIFAWSVREETGLEGAAALAAALGPSVKRVHAVDTFVSSDAPLESHRFAYAPIGKGAVVRALDNSSATPPAEVDRVVALARRAGIPIQVGTTNGGNDGAPFARYGAVDVPLSWPARYSHSPVETIDLADVDALAKLIAALAIAP